MTNMSVKELKVELDSLEIVYPDGVTKAELSAMLADAHGDSEGEPRKLTAEDIATNKFEDLKEGDVVIIPKMDDGDDDSSDEKKPDETPKEPEYKDGKYTVVTPIKFNGKVYEKDAVVKLDGVTAKSLGKAVEAK